MIRASEKFHSALKQLASPKQRARIRFGDTVFTNEDINITSGIQLTESINPDMDLTIGTCPSASLDFTIFNDAGLLNNFSFGECTASLGVLTDTDDFEREDGANVTVYVDAWYGEETTFSGYSAPPYLMENGIACAVQPEFAVQSIVVDNDIIYCFGSGTNDIFAAKRAGNTWGGVAHLTWAEMAAYTWGALPNGYVILTPADGTWGGISTMTWAECNAYTWDDLRNARNGFNAFMREKIARAVDENKGLVFEGEFEREYYAHSVETYEHVPLGVFIADMPEKVKVQQISVYAKDRMSLFDVDILPLLDRISYPISAKQLLSLICAYVGVRGIEETEFMNSGRLIREEPGQFADATAREVLKWLAEAAGCYAKFDRYGHLHFTWYSNTDVQITKRDYSDFSPAEYKISKINKLQVRNSDSDIGTIFGGGENAYVITDNPILYSETEIQGVLGAQAIWERLSSIPGLSPGVVNVFADWSIEAGDVIQIDNDVNTYEMPVYSQTLRWTGAVRGTYEFTGNAAREPVSETNRREYRQGRAGYTLKTSIDGLSSVAVRKDGVISSINQSPEEITIQAGKISLEGLVSVNGSFKINLDGSMEATGGKIAGWTISPTAITAVNGDYLGYNGYGKLGLLTYTPSSATFEGNIYARNISVGATQGYISTSQIGTGAVTSSNIGSRAVTTSKIGSSAVTPAELDRTYPSYAEFSGLKATVADIDSLIAGNAEINLLRVNLMFYRDGASSTRAVSWRTATILGTTITYLGY